MIGIDINFIVLNRTSKQVQIDPSMIDPLQGLRSPRQYTQKDRMLLHLFFCIEKFLAVMDEGLLERIDRCFLLGDWIKFRIVVGKTILKAGLLCFIFLLGILPTGLVFLVTHILVIIIAIFIALALKIKHKGW